MLKDDKDKLEELALFYDTMCSTTLPDTVDAPEIGFKRHQVLCSSINNTRRSINQMRLIVNVSIKL